MGGLRHHERQLGVISVYTDACIRMTFIHIVRFDVFTAVTMKNGAFWDVTPCGSWYFFAACVGC
jgi:hypothetical protein